MNLKFFYSTLWLIAAISFFGETGAQARDKILTTKCNPGENQGGYCNIVGNEKIYNLIKNTTVMIESPSGHGSGTIINKTGTTYTVITAAHVVNGISRSETKEFNIINSDNNKSPILSIETDNNRDIALVKYISRNNYPIAPISKLDSEIVFGGKISVVGYPLQKRGKNQISNLCRRFIAGCFKQLDITREKAQELGLNPEFSTDQFKPSELLFGLDTTRLSPDGGCRIYSKTNQNIYPKGYNISYDCVTYPGMSGGGVWDEETASLIAVHGLGKGINTSFKSKTVLYKAGINMGMTMDSVYSPTTNSLKNILDSRIAETPSASFMKGSYFLEVGDLASSRTAYKNIVATSTSNLARAAAYVNLAVSYLLEDKVALADQELNKALDILSELRLRIDAGRATETESSFMWRIYPAYNIATGISLMKKGQDAAAVRTFDKLGAFYGSELGSNMGAPGLDTLFSSLNKFQAELNQGFALQTGRITTNFDVQNGLVTNKSDFPSIPVSKLGFENNPLAEAGALWNLELWLEAIELNNKLRNLRTLSSESKKKMICQTLAGATINSYYEDPLMDYIRSSLEAPAIQYCLDNGDSKFLEDNRIIPPMFLMAM